MKLKKGNLIAILVAIVIAIILPYIGLNQYWVGLIVSCYCWAVMSMSLNLLVGYLGVRSLGQSAFWGIAAYMVAISVKQLGVGMWAAMGIALGSAILLGILFAAVSAHIKGSTYFMVSLALSQIIWGLAYQNSNISGGDNGLTASRVSIFPNSGMPSIVEYYYVALLIFIICAILITLIMRSPLGSTILGIRQSETRMGILGYNVWKYKFIIIVISAVFAGVAGIMNVQYVKFVSVNDVSAGVSAQALLMVLFGGAGTFVGPIIGAFVITLLQNIISAYTGRWAMVLGVIYVLSVFFLRGGLFGLYNNIMKRIKRGKDNNGIDNLPDENDSQMHTLSS